MNKKLENYIEELNSFAPQKETKYILEKIILKINSLKDKTRNIVFICTHNSRRSQYCEVWGNFFSIIYNKKLKIFSAGTIKTNVYPEVINSLSRVGIESLKKNKIIFLNKLIELKSKTLDEIDLNTFISIMTCLDAEKSCPVDKRSIKNISLPFKDPKNYDHTNYKIKAYDNTCKKIAKKLNYIIKSIN